LHREEYACDFRPASIRGYRPFLFGFANATSGTVIFS
jgi:hypothetical protein